MTKATMKAVTV